MIQNTPANPPLNGWRKTKWRLLEWPSQSPDLNPIEMLWHDLKKAVHARKPSNVAELQQFCQDEWAKIPPQRVAWRWSVCGTAEVVWKPRFLWQWPSAHLHFLVSCFSFSSWQYPIYSLWGSGMVSLLASQAHQHHGHLTNFWCFWQCGKVPNPAGKWNQHL